MGREQLVAPWLRDRRYYLEVMALAVSGSEPVCGGQFHDGGRSVAQRIAKWNGSSWSAWLGDERLLSLRWRCRAATCMRGADFTTAGGASANRHCQMEREQLAALGSGMDGTVYALAVSGSDLYAGGRSRRRAGARPTTLPNGTGAVGRPSTRG